MLVIFLLLFNTLFSSSALTADAPIPASPGIGRVSVSGADITVNGDASAQFFGVVDTTALQFAIMAYINGEMNYAGRNSVFNAPDTDENNPYGGRIPQNATSEQFWNQYFALLKYYDCNLVRIGAADTWGTDLQYQAYTNHRTEYLNLLDTMLDNAEEHGVWVVLVLAGIQSEIVDNPNAPYKFGGSGSVFVPDSSAYNRYIEYCNNMMLALKDYNSLGWFDMFNEPDHDQVNQHYWYDNKDAFHTWASAVADDTAGVTTHPRTMGVAGLGSYGVGLFRDWGQSDFDKATGTVGFEIAHRHYYARATDTYLFSDPEQWARNDGVPLFWGELGYNAQYPLVRWKDAEDKIYDAGGQAITSMVLTIPGDDYYPYTGGTLP